MLVVFTIVNTASMLVYIYILAACSTYYSNAAVFIYILNMLSKYSTTSILVYIY